MRTINLLIPLTLTGCLAGEVWPEVYAEAFCRSAYACSGKDEVEAQAGFGDEATCRSNTQDLLEADPKYARFQDGECTWVASEAKDCLDELANARNEAACDGEQPFALFLIDAVSPACARVYGDCD